MSKPNLVASTTRSLTEASASPTNSSFTNTLGSIQGVAVGNSANNALSLNATNLFSTGGVANLQSIGGPVGDNSNRVSAAVVNPQVAIYAGNAGGAITADVGLSEDSLYVTYNLLQAFAAQAETFSATLRERRQQLRSVDPAEPEAESEKIQVVVYTGQGRSVGLIVDRILDIAQERIKPQKRVGRQGTLGTMIVQGRVTELLDVKGIIQAADPSFFEETIAA